MPIGEDSNYQGTQWSTHMHLKGQTGFTEAATQVSDHEAEYFYVGHSLLMEKCVL